MGSKIDNDSWSALYESQLVNYQTAFTSDHNMDAKAGVVLASILAITAFVLNRDIFVNSNCWQFTLLIVGLILYATAVVMLVVGLLPKAYELPSNTTEAHPEYLDKSYDQLMYQLIVDAEHATKSVVSRLKLKSILFSLATIFFVTGTIILIILKLIVV